MVGYGRGETTLGVHDGRFRFRHLPLGLATGPGAAFESCCRRDATLAIVSRALAKDKIATLVKGGSNAAVSHCDISRWSSAGTDRAGSPRRQCALQKGRGTCM